VNAQRNDGWSALMRAARYGRTETVRLLIEAGADVNANSNDGETALMLASQYDHTGVVDILKQSGAR
jgi:ankyrin repeat protein